MRVDPTKKIVLNEGRSVGSQNFQYGGFPRIIKENEGATERFRDRSTDEAPNQATLDNSQEEALWADESLVHGGYRYPSKSLMGLAQQRDILKGNLAKLTRARGAMHDPTPEMKELGKQLYTANLEVYKHPHFQEFQKGHPSKRNQPTISATYGPGVDIDSSREGT